MVASSATAHTRSAWCASGEAASYFVKLGYSYHRDTYRQSLPLLEHLLANGIGFVSPLVESLGGELCLKFDGAALAVFAWIDGDNVGTQDSKVAEYDMLAQVYAVPTASLGTHVPRIPFTDDAEHRFYERWSRLDDGPLRAVLREHGPGLSRCRSRLESLAASSAAGGEKNGILHITHGDPGGSD